MEKQKDDFTRQWITSNALQIVSKYEPGILTLRGLHYQLVGRGMTNSLTHYKRVVAAMIDARWDKLVDFEAFSDHDRAMIGYTQSEITVLENKIDQAKEQVEAWMRSYRKNRWENQEYYPEVFIEKKALQGVFEKPCRQYGVALGACKGYPSLTFLNDTASRMINAYNRGQTPIILYFGDYDPSGEDIPRSIIENLQRLGVDGMQLERIALMKEQVIKWNLPPAPVKVGDSRTAFWDGLGQVELDAVAPEMLQSMCTEAIKGIFDNKLYGELLLQEEDEKVIFRRELKEYVNGLK
jgi:hypothetical protein